MNTRRIAKRIAEAAGGIESDTPIIPAIVADSVIEEAVRSAADQVGCTKRGGCECAACGLYGRRDGLSSELATRAEELYANDATWAKKIRGRGSRGRDTLHTFMRHWLAAELRQSSPDVFAALPPGFATGAGD